MKGSREDLSSFSPSQKLNLKRGKKADKIQLLAFFQILIILEGLYLFEDGMNLSKTKYQLFATILLGLMVLAWIGFLFFDAKKTKTPEVNQTFEAFLQEEETGQISQENADIKHLLDQQEQKLSLEDLDQLSSLKEKIALLEKQIEEEPSFEVKKLLLDAYVLEQRFPQASQLFSTFSPNEKSQLSPQLPFLIAFNSFSQTDPQAYQDLRASFQKGKEN